MHALKSRQKARKLYKMYKCMNGLRMLKKIISYDHPGALSWAR